MVLKKDKAKVLDEVWTETRIRGFLDVEPAAGYDRDFHCLLKAYQQMRADDFTTFLAMYTEQGRRLDATSPDGQTLAEIAALHRNSAEFVTALKAAGANL